MHARKITPLTHMLNAYSDWEGSRILDLLVCHPNLPIFSSVIESCLLQNLSPLEASNAHYHLVPIKMTDYDTLKAVDKRLNQLIAQKANAQGNSLAELESEMAALIHYRKECTVPGGGIKCFHDEDRAAYRRQSAAIRRLLNKAEQQGHHEAVAIVKACLRQGKQMLWEE